MLFIKSSPHTFLLIVCYIRYFWKEGDQTFISLILRLLGDGRLFILHDCGDKTLSGGSIIIEEIEKFNIESECKLVWFSSSNRFLTSVAGSGVFGKIFASMNRKERSVEGPDQKIAPEVHAAVDQDPSEVRPRKMAREESQCDNVAQYKISNIPV